MEEPPATTDAPATPAPQAQAQAQASPSADRFRWTGDHVVGKPWPVRVLAPFSSIRSAAALIAIFAFVSGAGTVYERAFGREAVAVMVYGAAWFQVIFALLALNIFGAAAVRFPWRRRQIGFVVVHLGLLTLMAGFTMSAGRLDGSLMATPDADAHLIELPQDRITVVDGERSVTATFETLGFAGLPSFWGWMADSAGDAVRWAWRAVGGEGSADEPDLIHQLDGPRPLLTADDGVIGRVRDRLRTGGMPTYTSDRSFPSVAVTAVALTARHEPAWVAAATSGADAMPAIKLALDGRTPGMPEGVMQSFLERWLSPSAAGASPFVEAGPATVSILRTDSAALIADLLASAAPDAATEPAGRLQVYWKGRAHRVPVDPGALPHSVELSDDLAVRITRLVDRPRIAEERLDDDPQAAFDPLALVAVGTGPAAERVWRTVPVFAYYLGFAAGADQPALVYEHPAVYSPAGDERGASVQLAIGPDRRLHLRWFSRSKGLGGTASVPDDGSWSGTIAGGAATAMELRLGLTYLAAAVPGPEPVRMRPDALERAARWIEFEVRRGDAVGRAWIQRGERGGVHLSDGSDVYIRYDRAIYDLKQRHGFAVHLDRFDQGRDPGGSSTATFASEVRVMRDGAAPEPRRITMNEPLDVGGVMLYQSSFIPDRDEQGQEIPGRYLASVFTAATDPGWPLKAVGSALLVLGMLIMYLMRRRSGTL